MKRLHRAITSSWAVYLCAGALMLWGISGAEGLTQWHGFGIGISLGVAHIAGGMYTARLYEAQLNRQAREIESLERELEKP